MSEVNEMKAVIESNAEKLAAFNLDWRKVIDLLDKMPIAVAILKQLISLFVDDTPPVVSAFHPDDGCCDHKELCRRTVTANVQALCTSLQHYEVCCKEECNEG